MPRRTPEVVNPLKAIVAGLALLLLAAGHAKAQGSLLTLDQGHFLIYNASAPTHLTSADGPTAGRGIYGQMLFGETPDSLAPVYVALEHAPNGVVGPITFVVDDWTCLTQTSGYAQFLAWDGTRYGTDLANVPQGAIGRTDIVPVSVTCLVQPATAPIFSRGAVVPIPEPSLIALSLLSLGALILKNRFSKKIAHGHQVSAEPASETQQ